MNPFRIAFAVLFLTATVFTQDHLLITEIVVTPTDGEFVEIHNPTGAIIDLSNYYLTDATFASGGNYYYNIVTGADAGGGGTDFHVRFPQGASIAPGEFQTIALSATAFASTYGSNPTYEMLDSSATVPNMREAFPGAVTGSATLSNSGEVVILYFWDGQSDLVQDVDYVVWGDKAEAVDKTGVSIDGPDPDATPSTYLADTGIEQQVAATGGQPHSNGESSQRISLTESGESQSSGNGITGHDETSENLAASFVAGTPNPGSGPGGGGGNQPPVVNLLPIEPPDPPDPNAPITVFATVTDDGEVVRVELHYALDGGTFTTTGMSLVTADQYSATIPAQPAGTVIDYFATAVDDSDATTTSDTLQYVVPSVPANPPPVISNVTFSPDQPQPDEVVTVTATITDESAVVDHRLFFSVNSAPFDSVNMNFIGNDRYAGFIPGQPGGSTVDFFVLARDDSGAVARSDTLRYTLPGVNVTPIADIQANPGAFTEVTVEGVVTLAGGSTITTRTDAYIQDESGRGINLFSQNPPDPLLARGNRLRVTGTVTEFQGVTEITDFSLQLLSTGNALPEPLVLSTAGAGDISLEGTYIQTSGIIQEIATAGPGTNITIDDGSGPVVVRVWDDTGIDLSEFNVNDPLTVTAVMDLFNNAAQLTPSVQEELAKDFGGNPPPTIGDITQSPSFPAPGENVTISATVTDNGTIAGVQLFFSFNDAPFDSVAMNRTSGDTYQAQIPGQPEGTRTAYFIKARDDEGATSTSPQRTFIFTSSEPGAPHLLITELAVLPTDGEFVEIFNPTDAVIDLSNYYLTDATFAGGGTYYYNIVTGSNAGGGDFGDFHARFPAGAGIGPNETQIIALNGAGFLSTYPGVTPTYELFDTDANIPDMREALPGSINNQGGLTNSGEVLILYFWDGQSDLVQDVDYLVWGDKAEAVDKSGVSIDGPDAGNTPSTYQNDTPIDQQIAISPDQPHQFGETVQRAVILETDEVQFAGNGITGHDETSENLAASFVVGTPNPGEVPLPGAPVIESVTFSPAEPTATDAVEVTARAIDADGSIALATLSYSVDGGSAVEVPMSPAGENQFRAQIPPQPHAALVQFSVTVTDNDGKSASSPGDFYVVGAQEGVIPIATIQNNSAFFEGVTVTIEGVVTLGAGVIITSRVDAYIQDGSGKGINLFGFDPPNPAQNIDRFKQLRVTGTVTEFNGVTEITNFTTTLIAENQPLPAPLFVRTGLANDLAFEGTYMRVLGEVTDIDPDQDDNDTNITLRDEQGTVLVRVWEPTGIDLSGINVGDTIVVQGVMDVFNGAAQIVPGYPDEIIIPGKTARADGSGRVRLPLGRVEADSSYENFAVEVIGSIDDTIATVRVDVPVLWQPLIVADPGPGTIFGRAFVNGNPVDPQQLEGGVEIAGPPFLTVKNLTLQNGDTLSVQFDALLTPETPHDAYFWVRTAGINGRLRLTEKPGRVMVGNGGRQLMYDVQTDSRQFGTVNLQGVTTIGVGLLRVTVSSGDSVTSAYIQDESGRGVNLFRFGFDRNIRRGNRVAVQGTVVEFNGVTEIEYTGSTLLAEDQPLPAPVKLTNAQANSPRWDGTLIATEGVIIEKFSAGGGTTLEISDGQGSTNVRVWDTARLDLEPFNINDRILVEGVGGLFLSQGDSIFQLLTTYPDQIRLDPDYAPTLDNVALRVEPHPFVPDRGETIDITYNAAAVNNQVTVRIFDLGGRLVATLLEEAARVVERTFSWNGRNDLNERVPLGTYICHLEVIEPQSGKKRTKVAPVVVGAILSR